MPSRTHPNRGVGRAARYLPCVGLMESEMTIRSLLLQLVLLGFAIALITFLDLTRPGPRPGGPGR